MKLSDGELEILRRSIVMLAPGTPSGLSREQAMELLAELAAARRAAPQAPQAPGAPGAGDPGPGPGSGSR